MPLQREKPSWMLLIVLTALATGCCHHDHDTLVTMKEKLRAMEERESKGKTELEELRKKIIQQALQNENLRARVKILEHQRDLIGIITVENSNDSCSSWVVQILMFVAHFIFTVVPVYYWRRLLHLLPKDEESSSGQEPKVTKMTVSVVRKAKRYRRQRPST